MAKSLRLLGVVLAAGLAVPVLGVGPAAADNTTLTPTASGYFYAEGIRKPDPLPAAPPNVTGNEADGVAKGNLAVAARAGSEDKVSFLLYDLLDLAPGAIVSKATLTLPLVPNDANNNSYGQDPAKVRACMAGPEGFNGDDGSNIQDAPARKCKEFSAPAKLSADTKSYVFDITKLAQLWVDTNNDGLALTAAEGATTAPFQVVFAAAEKAQLALSFTAPAALTSPPVAPVGSGTTGTPDLGSSFSSGVAPAPPVDSGFASVAAPELPAAPAPAPGVAPAAAPAVAAPAAVAAGPVALDTSLRPTGAFWLAGLLLALALALLSLILGDSTVPLATARPSRLTRALSDRQRGVATARPAFGRPATI